MRRSLPAAGTRHLCGRLAAVLALCCAIAPLKAAAQAQGSDLEFSISPSPVGSGARAEGMSNAFVAIADDATAASWNPAGLVQLERPEVSLVGALNLAQDSFEAFMAPGVERDHTTTSLDVNFLSLTYPLYIRAIERNLSLSISLQHKYGFDRQFDLHLEDSIPKYEIETLLNYGFDQKGALSTITPAVAFEVTHRLSVGVAVNLWRDTPIAQSGWEQTVTTDTQTTIGSDPPEFTDRVTRDTYKNLEGENFSIGLLWQMNPKWTLGMRYDTSFKAKVHFDTVTRGSNIVGGGFHLSENRTVSFPSTFSAGVAYRSNDRLTVSADFSTTDWDTLYYENGEGARYSLVDGTPIDSSGGFDRTWTFRFGTEYVFLPKTLEEDLKTLWTIRGGVLFDQEPASGRSTFDPDAPGDGAPDQFYGASIGAGVQLFNRINIDTAYQIRYGNNVNSDRIRNLPGFSEDLVQHRFLLSAVVYF